MALDPLAEQLAPMGVAGARSRKPNKDLAGALLAEVEGKPASDDGGGGGSGCGEYVLDVHGRNICKALLLDK